MSVLKAELMPPKIDGRIKFELGKDKNNCWDNFFITSVKYRWSFQAALTEIHA